MKDFYKELEQKIQSSYTEGMTLDEAEKLAAEFLKAQIVVSRELQKEDLDSRMRKTGLKAVRAAIYSDSISKSDKKPTEAALDHMINSHEIVCNEQNALDTAESNRDELERYYNIFREAHVYYRGVAKGRFE